MWLDSIGEPQLAWGLYLIPNTDKAFFYFLILLNYLGKNQLGNQVS